jgi:hypothetical protein
LSQALRDLPDPTQPTPVLPTANADDLLAKMADEAIDKLLAEADKGPTQPAIKLRQPPAPADEKPAEEAAVAEAAVADMLADAVDPVTPAVDERSTPEPASTTAIEAAPPAAAASETTAVETAVLLPEGSSTDAPAAPAPAPAPVVVEAPKDDVKALLTEEIHARPSPLLWPLWLLNAPFAWMSDRARQTLGLIGIVTLVPAVCAIVYVIYMKNH